eukprot:13136428-Ditylum_brightwellii.AAC.1
MLTNQENIKAIFRHQPKRHQAKYVLEKEEVENDLEKLRIFYGCHTADEADGTYAAVIKNQHDSKCACDRKKSGKQSNCAKGANKHSSRSSNGNHCATTHCRPGRSNASGHDGYCPRQDDNQHNLGRYHYDNHQNHQSGRD